MERFLNKLFTFKNLSRLITIFLIGMMLRYFINEYLHINIFVEYLGPVVLMVSSILNFLFIESWLYVHCKFYGYNLGVFHINPNQSYGCNTQYYNAEGRLITGISSELSNYNLDSNTRRNIASKLFEEIAQPTKHREVFISCNGTGNILLGIKYYDKPSNPYGLYVKYCDIYNQGYIWNVWEKDTSGIRFSEIQSIIHPRVNIWKNIQDVTGTNVSREVCKLLKTDPFHMNK